MEPQTERCGSGELWLHTVEAEGLTSCWATITPNSQSQRHWTFLPQLRTYLSMVLTEPMLEVWQLKIKVKDAQPTWAGCVSYCQTLSSK